MKSGLLRAKLHRPVHATAVIPRLRLLSRLQEGLSCKVTLVSAAAGFGKSTLLSAWLDQVIAQPAAQRSQDTIKASWLTLDKSDNQLPRFLHYLVAAIEDSYPQTCLAVTALLHGNTDLLIEAVTDALANCLTLLPGRLVLVLDDIHEIDDPAIYAMLTRLVQFAPPSFHLVLSARIDPPLPLSRWRAQGQLNEVRQGEMCFTLEEAGVFLETSLADAPAAEVVAALHRYTEGWPVGLRLAALALRGHADPDAFLKEIAAQSHRYAVDYLRDDVLDQQSEALQEFLVCTSILKCFCPALCAAVLQIDETTAQQHLQYIQQANLFLVDLSSPPLWYRYHHQFQSMLLTKLNERYDQAAIAVLHRRAAAWLADNDEIRAALEYMTAVADFESAADLIEKHRVTLFSQLREHEIVEALTLIPEPLLNQRPILLISAAWIHGWRMDWEQCAAKIQRVENVLAALGERIPDAERRILELELVAVRCMIDLGPHPSVSLAQVKEAWARAQPILPHIHSSIVDTLAQRCQRLGDIEAGLTMISSALEQSTDWSLITRCNLLNIRALMRFWDCDLPRAELDFQANLHMAQQHGFPSIAALCHLVLGAIATARHQLDAAEAHFHQVLTDLHIENARFAMLAVCRLIDIYAFQGHPESARPIVERFKEHAALVGVSYLHDYTHAVDASLAMACGDLPRALGWALRGSDDRPSYTSSDRLPIVRARILLAEKSPASLHKASQILLKFIRYLESQNRRCYLVEACGLQALALAELGQREHALAELGKAVHLAVPNGMVGHFIQLGQPMRQLLHALSMQAEYAQSAELLLAAFPVASPNSVAAHTPTAELPESLTDRECDVLRLMAAGLSNKEIAQQLVISAHTVRNHTANIFGKLQVDSRLQAVDRARLLGLLPQGPSNGLRHN